MNSVDLQVLKSAFAWRNEGHAVCLFTVIETWGSAPRLPGAMLAIRDDGQVVGSVSGGCIEDDLVEKIRNKSFHESYPRFLVYGVLKDEAARFGLPCGGTLRLLYETINDTGWIAELLQRCVAHEITARTLNLASGRVSLETTSRYEQLSANESFVRTVHGPRWRLLVIGAGELSRYLAMMAQALDYEVIICDPREEYADVWDLPHTTLVRGMPDDVVLALNLDDHSAVVALTHDPKLDDMALLEALKSRAFYVGALGSRSNTAKRRERLKLFDLDDAQIERLHGPIGLRIGSRTPPEIAISILSEITAVKNCFPLESVNDKTAANVHREHSRIADAGQGRCGSGQAPGAWARSEKITPAPETLPALQELNA
jgi:xanthine dehydrogenase accessory factor